MMVRSPPISKFSKVFGAILRYDLLLEKGFWWTHLKRRYFIQSRFSKKIQRKILKIKISNILLLKPSQKLFIGIRLPSGDHDRCFDTHIDISNKTQVKSVQLGKTLDLNI